MKIEVYLKVTQLIRFGLFDTFLRKRGWVRPALFAAILSVAAAICFLLHERRGAVLLGGVLLAVALGLPAAYFLSYFLSLRGQARGLAGGKYVYTVELGDEGRGVAVDNGQERAAYPWGQIFHAYRRGEITYLYITEQRAFLLPHGCVKGGGEALWTVLERRLPADRRTDR